MVDAVFVVGTGRSGTHFTCRALSGFANIHDPLKGREKMRILRDVATAAIFHDHMPERAIRYYEKRKTEVAAPSVFVDQHHPNLYFTDQLARIFDDPIFLYPRRPVVQVVASMLKHSGVLNWYRFARKNLAATENAPSMPFPNRFLGLTDPGQLDALDVHQLCALRVLRHNAEMTRLANTDPRHRFVSYKNLVLDQEAAFHSAFSPADRQALGEFRVVEEGKPASLDKYRSVLSAEQILDIETLEAEHGDLMDLV